MRNKQILLMTYLFLTYQCSFAADSHHKKLMDFYPISAGMEWEYSTQEENKLFSQYVKCNTLSDSQFVLTTESIRSSQYFFRIDSAIVKITHFKIQLPYLPCDFTVYVEPEMPVFAFNKSIGDGWNWQGSFNYLFYKKKASISAKIVEIKPLEINGHTTECLQIMTLMTFDGTTDTLTAYYGSGIGLVKQVSQRQNKVITSFKDNYSTDLIAQAASDQRESLFRKIAQFCSF